MTALWPAGLLTATLFVAADARAATCGPARPDEPPRAYLLTLSPGAELFAKFGHSVLSVSGGGHRDVAYSWGAFDTSKEEPVSAFLDGRMHYWLDRRNWAEVERRAATAERVMVAQELALSPDAWQRLGPLLDEASRPENHSYAYDWRDQNCSTKVRDVLDAALDGALHEAVSGSTGRTWRGEVLRHLAVQPIAWFGWHFFAASAGDEPVERWRGLFLPDRLMASLATVQIGGQPLVSATCTVTTGVNGWAPTTPPRGWPWTLPLGFGWAAGVAFAGRRLAGGLVAGLGLIGGGLGAVTVWIAATSAIQGIGYNLNWCVANPATLLLIPAGLLIARGAERRWVAVACAGLAVLGLVGLVVGLPPWAPQDTFAISAFFLPPLLAVAWRLRAAMR